MHKYKETRNIEDAQVYTHYPALPDVMSGIYAIILDTENEAVIRIAPTMLSLFMLIFVWLALCSLIEDKSLRVLSLCSLLLSNYFISYADNLHKHIYEELFKWIFLVLLILYYKGSTTLITTKEYLGEKKHKFLYATLLILVVFLASHSSFEPITYIAVTVVGFSWVFERKIFTPINITLGLTTIGAFAFHLYLNSLYLGSWDAAIADITNSLSHRTLGKESGKNYFTFLDFIQNAFRPFNRAERMFLIPGWAYIIFCFMGLRELRKTHYTNFQLLIVLLLASYSWALFMPQHSFIHPFTVRQFGIFITLTFGLSVYSYINFLKERFKNLNLGVKTLNVLLITYVVLMFLTQHGLQLYIKYGFFFKSGTQS